jgi:endoribonuclease Dicer
MYNQVMRDYYVPCPIEDRPNIFGMTASPVWNVKNPIAALQELKWNMFASIVAVKQHVDELAAHAPRPKEVSVVFAVAQIILNIVRKRF